MPTFTYRGYNASGQKVGGFLGEETQAAAERCLQTRGVSGYTVFRSETRYGDGITLPLRYDELAVFCNEAAGAFTDGVDTQTTGSFTDSMDAVASIPITAAVDLLLALAQRQTNRQLRLALFEISGLVARGYAPANVFAMYGHVFGLFFTQLVATANDNADFCGALADLSRYYAREAMFAQQTRRKIWYPAIGGGLLCLVIAVAAAYVGYIGYTHYFNYIGSIGYAGSAGTAGTSSYAAYSGHFGYVGYAGYVGLAAGLLLCVLPVYAYMRGAGFRRWMDMRLATLPFARRVTMTLSTLRLARGLALLTRYDIPLPALLDCARPLARNRAVEDKVIMAVTRMQSGKDLPATLEAFKFFAPFFPPVFYNALLQGYVSGNMADRLAQLCPSFEQQAEDVLRQANRLLVAAVVVAVIVILLPYIMSAFR